ncbi:TetR family transcriptional regulator [Dactylosporangium aurantiacum]|uniref:TetR family transcriptional regulator n=1 Tax=Dactylosporangium aurantiacum TaxID=35754 RepID=A0A9Q9IKN9_9ACTN|nr:TetR family transcriptional regulator [Dactylosporangium aurantiacum]MDG6109215.1 TetR family transcriptional regulator [Dactylosporangium aurantiacum]UWZ56613.1 TetR family transcriptional regulator [Dactylosporangium aurantiacum]
MNVRDADRKTRLADAAIEVVGTGGVRALTHRAVDTRAGLPQGTCSYHFPSRAALLTAALTRIAALDLADAAAGSPAGSRGGDLGGDLGVLLAAWAGPQATRTRARFMLMLDPQARAELGDSADTLAGGFVRRATELFGSEDRARLAIALVDGLLLDELTRGALTGEQRAARLAAIREILTVGQ